MNRTHTRRNRERGSAMLVTLILIAALLAGVAVLVSLQLTTSKGTELTRVGLMSLHCAESGLAATHSDVALNKSAITQTGGHLDNYPYVIGATSWQVIPSFITTAHRDVDGDGVADVDIWIIDNEEADGDYNFSTDSAVWLISRCTKYPDNPKEVRELIEFAGPLKKYKWQDGGEDGANSRATQ